MTDQELLMSHRKHSSAALTTEQFAALDYIPRSVLVAKRAMDIAVALIGLVVTAPLWPLVALAIRLDSPGPVIYRQMRVGRILADRTELFMILKFRSMRADAEKGTGAVWAQKHDPRITRVGAFIRKTRLDELPQLINVLRGDMSVVGPRPERVDMYLRLERAVPFYADRTAGLRPGITGLTQVVQGYGLESCPHIIPDRAAFRHAAAEGKTAMEIEPNGKAAEEIRQLYKWACEHVNMQTSKKRRTAA